jgi:hypothetical protein
MSNYLYIKNALQTIFDIKNSICSTLNLHFDILKIQNNPCVLFFWIGFCFQFHVFFNIFAFPYGWLHTFCFDIL